MALLIGVTPLLVGQFSTGGTTSRLIASSMRYSATTPRDNLSLLLQTVGADLLFEVSSSGWILDLSSELFLKHSRLLRVWANFCSDHWLCFDLTTIILDY